MSSIPQQIGNYVLEREIGRGSAGEVWLAHHMHLVQRQVAVKVLMSQDRESVARFTREANIAVRLQHDNIVQVFDHGHNPPFYYTVLEYIHGGSLGSLLERQQRLPLADALQIFRQVGLALDYAHSLNVVHRDVSPGNILVEQATGRALLTDFGIAREPNTSITTTQAIMGTPGFWSPEHVRSATAVTHLSDIYGLGVVLYMMLSGSLPWEDPPEPPVFAFGPPLPLKQRGVENMPSDMDRIIQTLLAPDPAKRFPTAQAAVAELERVFVRHNRLTEVMLLLPGTRSGGDEPAAGLDIEYEADGVQANAVETALGPDLVRAPISEAHQRAEELRQPAAVARLLDTWAEGGWLRRRLLGRMAKLHKVSSRNIYFYELRVLCETRKQPDLLEEPDHQKTVFALEPAVDRWQVPLPPPRDLSVHSGGEVTLPGSVQVAACNVCRGKGKTLCPQCKGRQRVPVRQDAADDLASNSRRNLAEVPVGAQGIGPRDLQLSAADEQELMPCPTCEGRGGLRCEYCDGIGRMVQRQVFHWQRDLQEMNDSDELPTQHAQWLRRSCQAREIYRERTSGGLRTEWRLVPVLKALVQSAEEDTDEETHIVLSEAVVSFIPVSDIVFDLGAPSNGKDAVLYRLSIYGFENAIPSDWRFLNWERVQLIVGGSFLLVLMLVLGFFAFAR